jgi:hypothetical protein
LQAIRQSAPPPCPEARLGEHIVWRKQRTFNQETQKYEEEWMPQGASFLRTGIELGREVSRDSGNQVIFVEGGDSFLLRRRPYDKTFKKNQYSPDPSEPSRGWPGWKSLVESLRHIAGRGLIVDREHLSPLFFRDSRFSPTADSSVKNSPA